MQILLKLSLGGIFCLNLSLAADPRWIRVQSANFDVYSTAGEKGAREILQHFEQVRNFFEQAAGRAPKTLAPVRIIAFASKKEYDPYRLNEFATAYYHQSGGRDYIVMSSTGAETFPVAVHEYVHLVGRHAKLDYPPWLSEGVAELYSTLRPMGDKVMVGSLIPGRFQALHLDRWVPLAAILAADHDSPFYNEKNKAGSLYNEGWALTHMLALSQDYRPKFTEVLQKIEPGRDSAEILSQIYGKPFAAIEKDLQMYLRGDRFQAVLFPVKLEKKAEVAAAGQASPFDVNLLLADLTNQPGKEAETRKTLEALAREDPKRPEPYAALGYLALRRSQMDEVRKNFAKAFELGDRTSELLWIYGRLAESESPEESIRILGELLKLEPDRVEARIELAAVHLRSNKAAEALETIGPVRKVSAEDAPRFFEVGAYALLQSGRTEEAGKAAKRWLSAAKTPEQKSQAERFLEYLANPRGQAFVNRVEPAVVEQSNEQGEQGRPKLQRQEDRPLPRRTEITTGRPSVEGFFTELDCDGVKAKFTVDTDDGKKVFVVEDPGKITVGGPAGTMNLSCGSQKPVKVRIEYDPPGDTQQGIDGVLRLIRFDQ